MTMKDPFTWLNSKEQRTASMIPTHGMFRNEQAEIEGQILKFVRRFNNYGFSVVVDENERRVGIRGPDGNGWWLFTDWRGK